MGDEELLAAWAERAGMPLPRRSPGALHGWGDLETAFEVQRDGAGFVVVRVDRGHPSITGRFADADDADAFLLVCFGTIWRADRGLGDVFPADPASGASLVRTDDGWVASIDGHEGVFGRRPDAKRFTYVGGKSLSEAAAFLES